MRAVIAGAGPAGLACAKWLTDRGYDVVVLEKRAVPGGKVSAWKDADGDWVESGLHVFFGAYHTLLGFLDECGLGDSFDWKPAEMIFASPEHGLAPLRFVPGLPAPFNGLAGVATSKLLPLRDKLRVALGLLWPIFGSQAYLDAQDDQSYEAWHRRHGMGERALRDVMDTMALSLNFQRADQVSAKLLLTALLHFAKKTDASKMALVKGSPHERLWTPLIQLLERRGAQVRLDARVAEICYDGERVTGFVLDDGTLVEGDLFISAMPVHSLRKVLPPALRAKPFFDNLRHLKGQPVITVQFFFDRQVTNVNNLLFSSHSDIGVYADMTNVSEDYARSQGGASVVQFVVAPAAELIKLSDEALIAHVLADFCKLHPLAATAKLRKYTIVRIPNSVYQARPGVDQYRPDQATPVANFFLAGDYTQQEFLASIEGAVRSAQRCVARIDAAQLHNRLADIEQMTAV